MQIHWHEGLFLQPQHLQRMQQDYQDLANRDRRLYWPHSYGIIEAQLSPDELANFRLRFDSLRVLMPSGREVCFPENADLPSLDLKPILASSSGSAMIFLGLPVWQEKRANTIETGRAVDTSAKLIYRVAEVEVTDENTGDGLKPVLVRRLNARFVLEQDDKSDLEVVPLLRVTMGTGEQVGQPRLDTEHVPPCLFLKSSSLLLQMVRDLVNQVEASRKELLVQINRGGFSIDSMRGPQFEQVMRLRTLNRYSGRMPALLDAGAIPPFQWYLELRELLGELAALRPDQDEFEAPAYRHDNLYHVFSVLTKKVRAMLRGSVAASYIKVDFRREPTFYAATFSEEHFTQPTDYFLAIKTKQEYRSVLALVEDVNKFKFMPRSKATAVVFGAKLKEDRVPPMQLPAQADLHYFRVLRVDSVRIWELIMLEKAAIVRWPGFEASDFQISLYMTLPS
jgi:type VI secretion system protein ImpJ